MKDLEDWAVQRCQQDRMEQGMDVTCDGCGNKDNCICASCMAITTEEAEKRALDKLPTLECGVCHQTKKIFFDGKHGLKMCKECQEQVIKDETPAYCYQETGHFCIDRTFRQETLESNDFGRILRCGYALGRCDSQVRTYDEARALKMKHLVNLDKVDSAEAPDVN